MEETTARNKIKTLTELSQIISRQKDEGKTVVLCHGVFDLLHPGHIRHFRAARKEGDILVVTLTQDKYVSKGPGRPIFNEHLRAESIAALEYVDYVAINEWPTAVETIKKLAPDIYCKGSDYAQAKDDLTGKIADEEEAVRAVGGQISFTNEITFSSTSLINSHFEVFTDEAQAFLGALRTQYSAKDIISRLQDLKKLRVLVIGDAIIDEYYYCTPLGKSAKENMIPAKYLYSESFAGGILAIANHVAGFCDRVDVVTCLGEENSYEEFILNHLKPNINPKFYFRPNAPTLVKRRFVEAEILRKLFELYIIDGTSNAPAVSNEISAYLKSHAGDYDVVIVGDYGHGMLTPEIIDVLCSESKFLAVNAQTNAGNIGFNLITKYPRLDYICIDEVELRLAAHNNTSPTEILLQKIIEQLKCRQASATLGHRGALVYKDGEFVTIPVFSREVVDRVGAGDAYLSITSLCAAADFPAALLGLAGNAMGALKIRIVGNKSSVEPVSLFKYINTLLK